MSFSDPWIEQADEPSPVTNGTEETATMPDHARPGHGKVEAGGVEVVVRLLGGDNVLVGRFEDLDEAKTAAEALVHALGASTDEGGDWPFVAGRFLRPGAVISIDVVEAGPTRWVGSTDRTVAWTGKRP